ncbi:MAG: 4Fe-4S binding protein [Anaerolineae bacterium]|nr:4Fe-4S binding protein [Anaerolineae bacterium]
MNTWLPAIDETKCNGCGLCVAHCPTQAVAWRDARPVIVQPERCAYCGMCEDLCPQSAISLVYEITSARSGAV